MRPTAGSGRSFSSEALSGRQLEEEKGRREMKIDTERIAKMPSPIAASSSSFFVYDSKNHQSYPVTYMFE